MSAGHGHARPNLKHAKELVKLLHEGGAPQLMQRWQRLDVDHDVPDLAGYNVAGTVRYIDRDAFRALIDHEYAEHILGEAIDTDLSPEQTIKAIVEHESDEKVILDGDNPVNDYESAHEYATAGEHAKVSAMGGTPLKYERGLRKIIKFCEAKTPSKVPTDLCCAPYLDEPDANDQRVLKIFRQLGVVDASKLSKRAVDYSPSTAEDQCQRCTNWQRTGNELSTCALVEGLVRNTYWCRKFAAAEQANGQELDRGGDQEQGRPASQPRGAGGREDSGQQDREGDALGQSEGT